jgi:hypothetical protein
VSSAISTDNSTSGIQRDAGVSVYYILYPENLRTENWRGTAAPSKAPEKNQFTLIELPKRAEMCSGFPTLSGFWRT